MEWVAPSLRTRTVCAKSESPCKQGLLVVDKATVWSRANGAGHKGLRWQGITCVSNINKHTDSYFKGLLS